MLDSFRHPSRSATLLAILLSCLMLAGCGVARTWYANLRFNDKGNDIASLDAQDDALLNEFAQRFGLMALLSEATYRRDLHVDERDTVGCAYLENDVATALPDYGMPFSSAGRWKRWVPARVTSSATVAVSRTSAKACLDDPSGLYYETYVLERQDQLVEAVIAFRGTENRSGQTFRDWRSNIAAFFALEPAQYAVARAELVPLVEALSKVIARTDGKPKIYATGHSLGGGLAQQAGFMSKDILAVYTFNSSPVTNWSTLRLDGQVRNAYPIIHRVYHGGEFLEKVRFITTSATKARFGRHDIGVQLKDRSNGAGHSIQLIACEFARLVRDSQVTEASHGYSSEWIRETLLDEARTDQPCSKNKAGA